MNRELLIKVASGQSLREIIKISRVEATLNKVPIKNMNELEVTAALYKLTNDIFVYFNSKVEESLIEMVIDDILDTYGSFSIIEIVKAISEGRKSGEKIYGKLSAAHIMAWIKDYDLKMTDELQKYHSDQNLKHKNELNNLNIPVPALQKLVKKSALKTKEERFKDRFTNDQKLQALKERMELDERQKETNRKLQIRHESYNESEHGDYARYMENI